MLALLLLLLQDVDALRGAVEKALPLLEKTLEVTRSERSCFNCHNLGMPLLALKAAGGEADSAGWAPDDTTAAVAHYFVVRNQDKGHWVNVSTRPPTEASPFTTTFVALAGLP